METNTSTSIMMRFFNGIHSQKVRFTAIIITTLYIALILIHKDQIAPPIDPIPQFNQLDRQSQAQTSIVDVGLHINSFPSFSFTANMFVIDGIVWFRFPEGAESLHTIEGFTLYDSFLQGDGKLLYKSPPIVKRIGNDVLISFHIQATCKTPLNHKDFPVGGHRLTIIIQNKNVTPYELSFKSSPENLTIAKYIHIANYIPQETLVQTGYIKSTLNPSNPSMEISYPTASFTINFQDIGHRDLISLYFPMFVIFFIGLFCLLLDVRNTSRLSYAATATPSLILFRIVIDAASPSGIGYPTHLDLMYYILVLLSLIILIFQTYIILSSQAGSDTTHDIKQKIFSRLTRLNDSIFIGTLATLALFITYTIWR